MDLRDLRLVLAGTTFKGLCVDFTALRLVFSFNIPGLKEGNLRNWGHEPTDITHMNSERIRNFEQSFF